MDIRIGDRISYWDNNYGIWRNSAVLQVLSSHIVALRPDQSEIWLQWADLRPPF